MSERPDPADLADRLDLRPHPEGGWFRRTWTSPVTVAPPGYDGPRPTATAIYYLLGPGEVSRWHTVASAELWLWHRGGPLTLELGDGARLRLGPDVAAGQQPQLLVPPGVRQRAIAAPDAATLVTCVVSPGFDFADFRLD